MEWDLIKATPTERADLAGWIALHKRLRPSLHSGRVVHHDPASPVLQLEGMVALDRSAAAYVLKCLDYPLTVPLGAFTLPGLDPDADYRVTVLRPTNVLITPGEPAWMTGPIRLPGRVLATVGLPAPPLHPDRLIIIGAERTPASSGSQPIAVDRE